MKIAVLGYSGSGKSTLARELALIYDIPVLYLDAVQFLPGWIERGKEEALSIVGEFMRNNGSWVIDGNYTSFYQQERLGQADAIIYMDFPRIVCLWSAIKRYVKYKNMSRESVAPGCDEKLDLEFVWWILHRGRTGKKRRYYREVISRYKDKAIVLKNRKQAEAYIKRMRTEAK